MCLTEYNEEETMQLFKEEGREEGRTEERRLQIANMLKKEKTPEAIAEFCGYPISLILEVKKDLEEVK